MHTLKNIYFCISILAINAAQAQTRTWTNIENNKIKDYIATINEFIPMANYPEKVYLNGEIL